MRAAVFGCVVLFWHAGAARADAISDYNQVRDPQLRLRACSEIIAGFGFGANQKAVAYRNRGNARADAGANAEALADFNQAVTLRPDEAVGLEGRARVRLAMRDFDGAIADYSEVLQLAPGTVSSHIGRGHAHFVRGACPAPVAQAIGEYQRHSRARHDHQHGAGDREGEIHEKVHGALQCTPKYYPCATAMTTTRVAKLPTSVGSSSRR
jgi:tetratricopeptide (TPR) repeat protein